MLVSIAATATLTGWSERTVWRRFSERLAKTEKSHGRSMIPFDAVQPHLCIPLTPDELPLLAAADAGDAESQSAIALIFLSNDQPKSAIRWLELAAKQGDADAMNLLGVCSIKGEGLPQDDNLGIAWIAKAAACGHALSQRQIAGLRGRLSQQFAVRPGIEH